MSSQDWWARKLSAKQQPAKQPPLPPTPVARFPQQHPQPQQPHQQPYQPPAPTPAPSGCPSCGSGNYGSTGNSAKRCFSCGYIAGRDFNLQAEGSLGTESGVATATQQIPTQGYSPNTIIGKVE